MATASLPAWQYQPRPSDPPSIKSMSQEDLSAPADNVALVDSCECPFHAYVTFSNGHTSTGDNSEEKLTFNFNNSSIVLPKGLFSTQSLPDTIGVGNVRYAAFLTPDDLHSKSESSRVIVLSVWEMQKKDIHNIYLILDDSMALKLMNAVCRLISNQSPLRAKIFHPLLTGKVQVAACSLDRHNKGENCCGPDRLLSFILDQESLGFYEGSYSNTPVIDFRFYKEQGPRAIDMISISMLHGHVEMKQGSNIYFIKRHTGNRDDEMAYTKLIQMFREKAVESQPEDYYTAPEKYDGGRSSLKKSRAGYSGQKSEPMMWDNPDSSQRSEYRGMESRSTSSFPIGTWPGTQDRQATSSRSNEEWQGGASYRGEEEWPAASYTAMNPRWLNDLNSGSHMDQCDEAMAMMWVSYEVDLKSCLESGTFPYSDPNSGGLDPNSVDHLQRSLEDIKDHLLKENMPMALSRLNSCLQTFGNTLLKRVEKLDQVELLKRIYFLSD